MFERTLLIDGTDLLPTLLLSSHKESPDCPVQPPSTVSLGVQSPSLRFLLMNGRMGMQGACRSGGAEGQPQWGRR